MKAGTNWLNFLSSLFSPCTRCHRKMLRSPFLQLLALSLLLSGATRAIPSIEHDALDDRGILPLGGVLDPSAQHLEIRGVVGGRKTRYILEREEKKKCCRKKLCLSVMGEILDKDCKCKKCPTGVPALDGRSCQDACPAGRLIHKLIHYGNDY
jgi:hypothetical protein